MIKIQTITLVGTLVRLEPLDIKYVPDLTAAGKDETIWPYMRYGQIDTEEKMAAMVISLLELRDRGTDLPFVVIQNQTNRAIGMTRYLDIQSENRGLEIGGTWYAVDQQHTGVNTECKFMLLKHAFEILDVIRVQLKTDLRNIRSQKAIERLGAVKEGILRDHLILPDGVVRSSVYYSILAREWPGVKQHIMGLMQR